MKLKWFLLFALARALFAQGDDINSYALSRSQDLKLGIYITAHDVAGYLSDDMGRREALSLFQSHGVSKAFIEFYRGGLIVEKPLLIKVKSFFEKNGIKVVGGIATVPGKNFGVAQQAKLTWFNWQNVKSQNDLKAVIQMAASVFDEIIIDDFFCSADTSDESNRARGSRSWSSYRRDLLVDLADKVFLEPARSVRPDIWLIIKFPQWYDRFHLFGYDVPRQSALFDQVWVGTETRGANTQRYGFVQPYEGFVNYRWIKSVSPKTTGAWFDHGDCEAIDFIDQAYQSVLAGAKELTLFSYSVFINGHSGHHLLRTQWDKLADLAAAIDQPSETVVHGYKPANSDAGGDLYIFDYIGMLGVPLVPTAQWPEKSLVLFLPTQAAADPAIISKIQTALQQNKRIIMTSGFLSALNNKKLTDLAGVSIGNSSPFEVNALLLDSLTLPLEVPLKLSGRLAATTSKPLLTALFQGQRTPVLTVRSFKKGQVVVLNTHTFSQIDFDRVDEVLLAPNKLGFLALPQQAICVIRNAFCAPLAVELDAPGRVTCQSMGKDNWFIQNYNDVAVQIKFSSPQTRISGAKENWNKELLVGQNGTVRTLRSARQVVDQVRV